MLSNASRFRRLATAFSFIAAGVLSLAGMLATPWENEDTTEAYLEALAANPTQAQVAAVLLHFGYLLIVPAAFGSLQLLRHRAVALGHIAVGLTVLGWATFSGFLIVDFYDLALAQTMPLETALAVEDKTESYGGLVAMGLPGFIGGVIGLPLLAVALWRAGAVPVWLPAILVVGAVASQLTPPSLLWSSGSMGLLLLSFTVIALRILRLSDEQWERGELPERKASSSGLAASPLSSVK